MLIIQNGQKKSQDIEYLKELKELHNDYSLAPDKIEIKREIANLYSIPIVDVKKIVPNFFDKEKKDYIVY